MSDKTERAGIPVQRIIPKLGGSNPAFDILRWGKVSDSYDYSRPHRHEYYEILLFFKGSGWHEIDFKRYKIEKYSLHFVPANSIHLLHRHATSDGATILFSEDFIYQDKTLYDFFRTLPFFNGKGEPVIKLSKADFEAFRSLFIEMEESMEIGKASSFIILKSLLTLFLAKSFNFAMINLDSPSFLESKNPIVTRYKGLVEKKFLLHGNVKMYADELHISAKHLNELCKRHLSITAQKVIHERLLLEIKRLLVYSDQSIKEVCFLTGFDDPSHFNHFFKFHMKLTPLEYRRCAR